MYGKIPEKVLDVELGEEWDCERFYAYHRTVRDIIESNGEEVEDCDFEFDNTEDYGYPRLNKFIAWTDSKVLILMKDAGEDYIISVPRHP